MQTCQVGRVPTTTLLVIHNVLYCRDRVGHILLQTMQKKTLKAEKGNVPHSFTYTVQDDVLVEDTRNSALSTEYRGIGNRLSPGDVGQVSWQL